MSELNTTCGNFKIGWDTVKAANLSSDLWTMVGSVLDSGMSIKCLGCLFKLRCLKTSYSNILRCFHFRNRGLLDDKAIGNYYEIAYS